MYYKGLRAAIDALPEVPGTLVVVGTGSLGEELRRQAVERKVADRIVWMSDLHDDQLTGVYHAATALWFPSNTRSEAFGLVQVEAMACGCPVLNAAIPGSGVPWVSPHEQTGLTVPINDPPSLAAATRRLLDEPGLRDRLAAAGRLRAAQEFDAEIMAQRSMDLYHRVLRSPQTASTAADSSIGAPAASHLPGQPARSSGMQES